jgi:HEAT repeats
VRLAVLRASRGLWKIGPVSTPEERLVDSAIATSLGDTILPDPEEVSLSRFRDATLLVLGVVAHAHGASAKEVRRATGQWPGAVQLSLRHLERDGLVEREHRPGADHWFATHEGTRLGVTPYVTRLLGAIKPLWSGWWGDWSVGRFRNVGTNHGPPIFSPAYALSDVNEPEALAEVIRTGVHDDRAYAVTKLIALKDPASVEILCEVARRRDEEEPLARQAVIALGSFATPTSIDTLIDIAGHRDSLMREAAARSLGRLQTTRAIPTLIELIGYASEPARAAAVRALGRIGDTSTATAIAVALADSDVVVRHCARHTLVQLGAVEQLKNNPRRIWPLRMIDVSRARSVAAHHSKGHINSQ